MKASAERITDGHDPVSCGRSVQPAAVAQRGYLTKHSIPVRLAGVDAPEVCPRLAGGIVATRRGAASARATALTVDRERCKPPCPRPPSRRGPRRRTLACRRSLTPPKPNSGCATICSTAASPCACIIAISIRARYVLAAAWPLGVVVAGAHCPVSAVVENASVHVSARARSRQYGYGAGGPSFQTPPSS